MKLQNMPTNAVDTIFTSNPRYDEQPVQTTKLTFTGRPDEPDPDDGHERTPDPEEPPPELPLRFTSTMIMSNHDKHPKIPLESSLRLALKIASPRRQTLTGPAETPRYINPPPKTETES
jgi:hypothetical protein